MVGLFVQNLFVELNIYVTHLLSIPVSNTNTIQGLDQEKPKPDTPVTDKDGPSEQPSDEQNDLPN